MDIVDKAQQQHSWLLLDRVKPARKRLASVSGAANRSTTTNAGATQSAAATGNAQRRCIGEKDQRERDVCRFFDSGRPMAFAKQKIGSEPEITRRSA